VVQRCDPEFLEFSVRCHVQSRVEPETVWQVGVVELEEKARLDDGFWRNDSGRGSGAREQREFDQPLGQKYRMAEIVVSGQ